MWLLWGEETVWSSFKEDVGNICISQKVQGSHKITVGCSSGLWWGVALIRMGRDKVEVRSAEFW